MIEGWEAFELRIIRESAQKESMYKLWQQSLLSVNAGPRPPEPSAELKAEHRLRMEIFKPRAIQVR
jgi:hypothetical protein